MIFTMIFSAPFCMNVYAKDDVDVNAGDLWDAPVPFAPNFSVSAVDEYIPDIDNSGMIEDIPVLPTDDANKDNILAGISDYFNKSTVVNEGNKVRIANVLKKS